MEINSSICGIWVGESSDVHLALAEGGRGRREVKLPFKPFLWAKREIEGNGRCHEVALEGVGAFEKVFVFDNAIGYQDFMKLHVGKGVVESVKPWEHQYLLYEQKRMFSEMHLDSLIRCQCDIETGCSVRGGFSNARREGDRVLAIGMRFGERNEYIVLEEYSDVGERRLLEAFNKKLKDENPDIIEGHNFFKFDLDYLRLRCKRLKVPCAWGRFGQEARFRNSRLRVAERWVDFPRCDIPGRTVFDTYLMIQLYDVTKRELPSYALKSVAVHLGIIDLGAGERTYIDGNEIQKTYEEDRGRFLAYLGDDLKETQGIANLLLPTYFAQVGNFPMTLQEATLRGSSNKVELIFLEKYYQAGCSLPNPPAVKRFAGGYTKSYEEGVFKNVLCFDVASLYPSLMLAMGKNPANDALGCFIPLLRGLREYRLEYKKKAREEKDESLKREYEARQQSFKILINSFYGYLGFEGARFADSELAAEITARGRRLLKHLIEEFQDLGCQVLEADTDGIYLSSEKYFEQSDVLLDAATKVMPEGVDLEYAGSYRSMFSYKAKNYALYNGERVIIRGSALRSRGMEPFLKTLTKALIHWLLGASEEDPNALIEQYRKEIEASSIGVEELAKTENLSQNPEAYLRAVTHSKKPRRASLEVALKLHPKPRMGERVTYFITPGEKARLPDWQQARPVGTYDPEKLPYDSKYYLRKLDDWCKRYTSFL